MDNILTNNLVINLGNRETSMSTLNENRMIISISIENNSLKYRPN